MKRNFYYTSLFLMMMLVALSCNKKTPKDDVRDFVTDFVAKMASNKTDSLYILYPELELADGYELPRTEPMQIEETSYGMFIVRLNDGKFLKVQRGDDGKMKVLESHGIFKFTKEELDKAKKAGILTKTISDVKLLEKMRAGGIVVSQIPNQNGRVSEGSAEMSELKEKESMPIHPILGISGVNKGGGTVYYYKGYFSDGSKHYPIKLALVEKNGRIQTAHYVNVDHPAKLKLSVDLSSNNLTMYGTAHGSGFTIDLSPEYNGNWRGDYYGDSTLEVFIEPTDKQFSF